MRGDADYRRHLVGVLTKRALRDRHRTREGELNRAEARSTSRRRSTASRADFLCEPRQSLLEVLRDELRLTGTKEGCNNGNCGACNVLLDGRLVNSCLVLGVEVEGRHGRRRSRASPRRRGCTRCSRSSSKHAALQCGICTPGFIVAAKALLDQNPQPDRAGGPPLAGRQPVPLHRLRQDRPRRPRRSDSRHGELNATAEPDTT